MPVATKTVETTTDFKCGGSVITIDHKGDICINNNGSFSWAMGKTEVSEFVAAARAYLAHIDSEEAANA